MESWDELQITVESTRLTYAYLRAAGRAALAQKTKAGAMTASMFAAFTAEAYFNHVGQARIAYWEKHLDRLSPHAKAVLLNDVCLHRQVNWSAAPYQTLAEAITYRNLLAHGKTQTATLTLTMAEMPDDIPWPQVKWEKCCDVSVAERLLADVEGLIEEMHQALGNTESAFAGGPKL